MAEQSPVARKPRAAKKPTRRVTATARWTKAFLAALADSSNVAAAARKAGIELTLKALSDPDFWLQSGLFHCAWGQKQ